MNLLRKKPAPQEPGHPAEGTGTGPAQAAPAATKAERQASAKQKAALRNARMAQSRDARKAVAAMTSPEPTRGLLAGVVLLGIGLFSWLSKDVAQEAKTVKGKTVEYYHHFPAHPVEALVLVVMAVVALATIYFRRRTVTVIAFIIAGAYGVDVPLPKADTDLRWVAFLVPAGYALWVYVIRMRKEQTAWVAAHPLPGNPSRAAGPRPAQKGSKRASAGSGRRRGANAAATTAGKPLPPNSGRYTQPKAKPRPRKPAQGQATAGKPAAEKATGA